VSGRSPLIILSMTNEAQVLIEHWRDAVPDDRLAHLIRDVSRAFLRALGLRLEKHGIPLGHWTFLRVLWESDGITQKDLSEKAGVMEPTTYSAMKSMEALGYIERVQLPPNRKNVYIYLTREGRALKKKLVPLAVQANDLSAQGISQTDLLTTRRVLLQMLENLAGDEASPHIAVKAAKSEKLSSISPARTRLAKTAEKARGRPRQRRLS
jgi:DNA-binding MarR family transcriptional regulator